MARNKGVSGKTHTKQQLDDYANQHNLLWSSVFVTLMAKKICF